MNPSPAKRHSDRLAAQLRRGVVSIASNIAEGHRRTGSREFLHHLSIARGSLSEVETQMEIARRLGYITGGDQECFCLLAAETGKLINGLITSLERKAPHRLTSDLRPLTSAQK